MSKAAPWQLAQDPTLDPMDRIIEVLTVLLLGIATVGSAWCAYQVSQWNSVSSDEARRSGALRIDASREFGLATQKFSYDATLAQRYAEARLEGDDRMITLLRESLARPEFVPVLDELEEEAVRSGGPPPNLLEHEEYVESLTARTDELDVLAADAADLSDEADRNAEDYVLTTLFMAAALFFAGVTGSFNTRSTKLVLLAGSIIVLAVAAARIIGYPVA